MTEFVLLLLAGLAVNALALLAVAGGLFLIVRSHEPGAGRFGRVAAASNFFIAAALDDYLRAFDAASGDELWKARLPAGGQATPMSYEITFKDGHKRQYVVVAAGGHGRSGSKLGDSLVAFALRE